MSSKPKKTKRWGEVESAPPKIEEKPQISYKLNQICVDVKIVDIRPDNERCIGFVYVRRDGTGTVIKERTAKHGKVVILEPLWGEEVSYMTLSDFEAFIEGRKKCYTL